MKRRRFLSLVGAGVLSAGAASAQSLQDHILRQLRRQGYRQIQVSRTLLGRTRILALGSNHRREIIFNPRTGEILRDFWQPLIRPGSSGGSANGSEILESEDDDDDDEDDDEGDDEGDDDDEDDDEGGNSGPGGGGGSGNSGKG